MSYVSLNATLPIVLPLVCLLSHFLVNNGNGRLSVDGVVSAGSLDNRVVVDAT